MRVERKALMPGDKDITMYINTIRVIVDYDDVDQKMAKRVADLIEKSCKEAK
jgi:hypothetical protein